MRDGLKCLLILGAALAAAVPALACVNTYTEHRLYGAMSVRLLDAGLLKKFIGNTKPDDDEIAWVRKQTAEAKRDPTYENRSDLAVGLMHLGKAREAIGILTVLEQQSPGRYQAAANLGTAYELAGDNESALRWVREGIRRNPRAHEGTEWLHAKILEAKLDRRPRGVGTGSLLNLDFGPGPLPTRPRNYPMGNDDKPVDFVGLGLALRYQLVERTHFVAAPDRQVAALLVDWAHMELIGGDRDTASVLYEAALRYGQPSTPALRAAQAEANRVLSGEEIRTRTCELCYR